MPRRQRATRHRALVALRLRHAEHRCGVENEAHATSPEVGRAGHPGHGHERVGDWMPVRLHTHDEILVETEERYAPGAASSLLECMEEGYGWSKGLPIAAETVVGRWYTKSKGSVGL